MFSVKSAKVGPFQEHNVIDKEGNHLFALLSGVKAINTNPDELAQDPLKIDIRVNKADKALCKIFSSGIVERVVCDRARNLFNLSQDTLKSAFKKAHSREPDEVFIRSPTPGQIYKKNGWEQVHTVLSVKVSQATELDPEEAVVDEVVLTNDSSETVTREVNSFRASKTSAKCTWKDANNVIQEGKDELITYSLSLDNDLEEPIYSDVRAFGEDDESLDDTPLTPPPVRVTLKPGQCVKAILNAQLRTVTANVVYRVAISGKVISLFDPPFLGQHTFGTEVEELLSSLGLPTLFEAEENLNIKFHINPIVTLKDCPAPSQGEAKSDDADQ